jgi:transposase
MGRAEVTWDKVRRRWYMAWAVTVDDVPQRDGGVAAAIDLGVRISASLSVEGRPQALHVEAREALKDWDWLGREIAREQSCIAGTRGPAREDRAPTSRAIARLHQLRRLRVEHAMRCMAKRIAEECDRLGVTRVYLGWPKGILREVKYGSSAWAGRIHAFWSFAKVLGYLEAALGKFGIAAARVGERGSSSSCPTCKSAEVTRSPRWVLRCRACGERMHSDQAGSRNILYAATGGRRCQQVAGAGFGEVPGAGRDGLEASPRTVTLRWDTHLWRTRFVDPGREGSLPEFQKAA